MPFLRKLLFALPLAGFFAVILVKLDDSRLLASMPLDSTSMPPNTTSTPAFEHAHVGPSSDPHRPTAYSAHHPLQHPAQQQQHHRHHHYHHRANLDPGTTLTGSPQQQHIGVGAEGEGEEASAPGCLPALLNPQPRRALLAQISRMIGFEQPPAMNQWCLVGPASFLSFGLWSLSLMVSLCQHEARPELWGRYAMVLNKQQGLLRDARLEVATPATGPASPNAALGGGMVAVNSHMSAAGGDGDGGWASPQLVGLSQSHLQQHQQPPQLSTTGFMPLPLTATHLDSRHLATLRLELARHLQVLEIALADRRGPPGTAAGEVAFPKGKEIMQSVIKRLRRRLGYGHGSIPGYG